MTTSVTVGGSTSCSTSSIKPRDSARPVKSDASRDTMAKTLTKALRGKRRWIGINVSGYDSRDSLEKAIESIAPSSEWKLTLFEDDKAIVKVRLQDLGDWRKNFEVSNSNIESVTTSGKIRLVKQRMGFS